MGRCRSISGGPDSVKGIRPNASDRPRGRSRIPRAESGSRADAARYPEGGIPLREFGLTRQIVRGAGAEFPELGVRGTAGPVQTGSALLQPRRAAKPEPGRETSSEEGTFLGQPRCFGGVGEAPAAGTCDQLTIVFISVTASDEARSCTPGTARRECWNLPGTGRPRGARGPSPTRAPAVPLYFLK